MYVHRITFERDSTPNFAYLSMRWPFQLNQNLRWRQPWARTNTSHGEAMVEWPMFGSTDGTCWQALFRSWLSPLGKPFLSLALRCLLFNAKHRRPIAHMANTDEIMSIFSLLVKLFRGSPARLWPSFREETKAWTCFSLIRSNKFLSRWFGTDTDAVKE